MKQLILIACCTLCLLSCEKYIFGLEYENTPEENFEAFWNEFDRMYGLFKVKEINWDEVYTQYRPMINNNTSDEALYHVLTDILELLDDGHTGLLPFGTDLPTYRGGIIGRIDTVQDFDIDLLKENYLSDLKESDFAFLYGWLEEGIGYLHIYGFGDGERVFDKEMEEVVSFFSDAQGLVIDIRGGYGGEDIAGKTIASHFTDQRRLYMTTSIKNGPGPDDFTTPEEWYIAPRGDQQLSMPVALLTNRLTISARETFALAMLSLPQVTTVGDTTSGAFSNLINRELPNGWGYSMSIGDWRAADGTSFEGVGIPPQIVIKNKREDVLNGKDNALEAAIAVLK
jgi:carboxyl-terminal processing protease